MSADIPITKEKLDIYLKEVAKQFRKLNKKAMPAEITLIGGASILVNYGFRDSTYDVDALIHASSAMKDAINYVTDTMGLPNGWLNEDFKNTNSYTPRLVNYSKYYRTFSNIVTVRTITGEYLVAMKLMAYRQYKHDISDIRMPVMSTTSRKSCTTRPAFPSPATKRIPARWVKTPGAGIWPISAKARWSKLYPQFT